MKNICFSLLIGIFLTFSVSAQNNFDNFIGNWELIQTTLANYQHADIGLNISQNSDEFKLERVWKKTNTDNTFQSVESFLKNGKNRQKPPITSNGRDVSIMKITFKNSNQVKLETKITYPYQKGRIDYETRNLTVSEDGKTLKIEQSYRTIESLVDLNNPAQLERKYYFTYKKV